MNIELVFVGGALLVALLALLLSPLVRAVCWDAFVHPRYRCMWEKRDNQVHEIHIGTDSPVESDR